MKKEHDKNDSPVTIFTGAGGSGDSPIFITEGSLEIVGINEDFQPAVAVPAVSFTVNKTSTIGSVKIKPGSVASNSGAAWSIALTETGAHPRSVQIAATTPLQATDPTSKILYFCWSITVSISGGSGSETLLRQPRNGGECRLRHETFVLTGATSTLSGFPAGTTLPTNHFSIHFR